MKKIILLLLVALTLSSCSNQNKYLDDFDYLCTTLNENYPFIRVFERENSVEFKKEITRYRDRIKKIKNDEDFSDLISEMLNRLHNGHTSILSKDEIVYYTCGLQIEKEKNYYYSMVKSAIEQEKVKDFYNLSDKESCELIDTITNSENNEGYDNVIFDVADSNTGIIKIKSMYQSNIVNDESQIIDFLHKHNFDTIIIDIRGNGGGSTTYGFGMLLPLLVSKDISVDRFVAYKNGKFGKLFFDNSINEGNDKYANFETQKEIVFIDNYAKKKGFPKELSEFTYMNKVTRIVHPSTNSINFEGNLFIIIDSDVYSASDDFASFVQSSNLGKIVGQTSGGDGIGSPPAFMALPSTGLVVKFSITLGMLVDGTIEEESKIIPDISLDDIDMNNINIAHDLIIR